MYKYKTTEIIAESFSDEWDFKVIYDEVREIEIIETTLEIELLPVELRYIVFCNNNVMIETGDIIKAIPDDRMYNALMICNAINRKKKVAYRFYVTPWKTIRMRYRFFYSLGDFTKDLTLESLLCLRVEMEGYYPELCKAIFTELTIDPLLENTSDSLIKALCVLVESIVEKK